MYVLVMSESGIAGLADVPPGPVLSALLYRFDLDQLTPQEAVPVLKAWSRQRAHDHARMARTMARVAALSRHADELVVGEWAGSEIAAALTWSESKAGREVEFAETLMTLPQVLAAFEAGRIDHGKAWVFTDVLGSTDLTSEQLAAVCAMFVPLAPTLTAGQLRHRLVRAILAVDAEWAGRRYRRAVAGRRVCGYLAADGTATISGSGLAPDQAAAACARVDAVADQLQRAGYPGTVGQIRADVFLRLLDGRLTGLTTPQIITALLADAAAAANPMTRPAGDSDGDGGSGGEGGSHGEGGADARADAGVGAGSGVEAGPDHRGSEAGSDPDTVDRGAADRGAAADCGGRRR
jgi:hypothetical protein